MNYSKLVWIVAIVSIALNLALVGFIAGNHTGRGFTTDPTRAFPSWARQLPTERVDQLKDTLREHMHHRRPFMQGLRQHHKRVRQTIQAEPFDPTALQQALTDWRTQMGDMRRNSDDTLVRFVSQLSEAERADFARHLGQRRRPPRHPPPP